MRNDVFKQMVDKWPSAIVAPSEVKRFTGGLITGKTIRNLSSEGEPAPESLKIGTRRAFVAASLADWLRKRSQGRNAA